jgi:hypothetical protein
VSASSRDLSPGARVAVGIALVAMGVALSARGADVLVHETRGLASEGMAIVPIGMAFAFAGLLLAVPTRYGRLRTFAGAVLMTAFALTFDWIAFGPGTREFGGAVSVGFAWVPFRPGEILGRSVFGVFALLLDAFVLVMWVHAIRRHFRPDAAVTDPPSPTRL